MLRAALSRHDALLRHAIESHGGQVFQTVGDFEIEPGGQRNSMRWIANCMRDGEERVASGG